MKKKRKTTKQEQGNRNPTTRPTLKQLEQEWENLTFTNDYIFGRVMHDEEICRQVVELILGIKIGKIQYLSSQDEHKTDPHSMRIIMDVFLRDENKIINVEV